MTEDTLGLSLYGIYLLYMGGIYAVLVLGLNVQWGFTGLFNAGIAGFVAVGAYTQAILTTPAGWNFTDLAVEDAALAWRETADPATWGGNLLMRGAFAVSDGMSSKYHIGNFELPIPVAMVLAMVFSAIIAYAIAKICIRLRSDYLAIATIGIAEILRLAFKTEVELTNGARGVSEIPRAFESTLTPGIGGMGQLKPELLFLSMVLGIVLVLYIALEMARRSPWGRVMSAIRDNETAAAAAGKNIERFRLESFVIGAAMMGLGGALLAQVTKAVNPDLADPLSATFLVWVMLIAGGSANNRGALLGAFVMFAVWSGTQNFSQWLLDITQLAAGGLADIGLFDRESASILDPRKEGEWSTRFAYVRVFLIGLILQIILQTRPQGLLPEKRPRPKPGRRGATPAAATQGD